MALQDLNPFAGRKKVKLVEGALTVLGDSVEFDASKDEDHTGENEVTDFPVEEGANITDHSRPKPRTLQIHAFVTGTPMSLLNIATPPGFKAPKPPRLPPPCGPERRNFTALRSHVDSAADQLANTEPLAPWWFLNRSAWSARLTRSSV